MIWNIAITFTLVGLKYFDLLNISWGTLIFFIIVLLYIYNMISENKKHMQQMLENSYTVNRNIGNIRNEIKELKNEVDRLKNKI